MRILSQAFVSASLETDRYSYLADVIRSQAFIKRRTGPLALSCRYGCGCKGDTRKAFDSSRQQSPRNAVASDLSCSWFVRCPGIGLCPYFTFRRQCVLLFREPKFRIVSYPQLIRREGGCLAHMSRRRFCGPEVSSREQGLAKNVSRRKSSCAAVSHDVRILNDFVRQFVPYSG